MEQEIEDKKFPSIAVLREMGVYNFKPSFKHKIFSRNSNTFQSEKKAEASEGQNIINTAIQTPSHCSSTFKSPVLRKKQFQHEGNIRVTDEKKEGPKKKLSHKKTTGFKNNSVSSLRLKGLHSIVDLKSEEEEPTSRHDSASQRRLFAMQKQPISSIEDVENPVDEQISIQEVRTDYNFTPDINMVINE